MTIWEVDDRDDTVEGLDEDGKPDPAYAAALGLVPAPLGRRAIGFAIDVVVYLMLQVPYWLLTVPLLLMFFQGRISWYGVTEHPNLVWAIVGISVSFGLSLAYCVVQIALHGRAGRTLGKGVMGLRSVNVKTLERPGIGRVLLRAIVLWGSGLLIVGPLVFLLSPLFDEQKRGRGWHDMVGRLWFVDARKGLNPYDKKRMRVARKTVTADPVPQAKQLPSLATRPSGDPEPYRPGTRVSAGVLGVARPYDGGQRPVVGLGTHEMRAEPEVQSAATPGTPVLGGYRPSGKQEEAPAFPSASARPRPVAGPDSGIVTEAPHTPWPAEEQPARPPFPQQSAPTQQGPPPGRSIPAGPAPARPSSPPAQAQPVPESRPAYALRTDAGETHAITGPTVLGRNPVATERVRGARLVPVPDDTRSVSKTHFAVRPVAQGVEVLDHRSTNGTFVVHDGAERRLTPWEPAMALAGDTIRFGDRTAVVVRA
ncbi:RDD family protein [Georgenia alba]|uniref:RDD family protein n=1 Tax=Georgenia alba TaxID=2233858 RepID=A0ABW2Q3C0_9MICO